MADDILNLNMDKDGYMLNPGLSALWDEEINRRKLTNITAEIETPDLEGIKTSFFVSPSLFLVYFYLFFISLIYKERTNLLKLENETDLRNRLISLLECR